MNFKEKGINYSYQVYKNFISCKKQKINSNKKITNAQVDYESERVTDLAVNNNQLH